MNGIELTQQSLRSSQEATRIYFEHLEALLKTIWWRPVPQLFLNSRDQPKVIAEPWAALSPTYFLSSVIPSVYADTCSVQELQRVITHTQDGVVEGWNQFLDLFRWTPKGSSEIPVIWQFPSVVQLSVEYAEAMNAYHQYIYMSMQPDLDAETDKGFFDLLMHINGWVGAFKRRWQGVVWEDRSWEDVKPRVREELQVQIERVVRNSRA